MHYSFLNALSSWFWSRPQKIDIRIRSFWWLTGLRGGWFIVSERNHFTLTHILEYLKINWVACSFDIFNRLEGSLKKYYFRRYWRWRRRSGVSFISRYPISLSNWRSSNGSRVNVEYSIQSPSIVWLDCRFLFKSYLREILEVYQSGMCRITLAIYLSSDSSSLRQ